MKDILENWKMFNEARIWVTEFLHSILVLFYAIFRQVWLTIESDRFYHFGRPKILEASLDVIVEPVAGLLAKIPAMVQEVKKLESVIKLWIFKTSFSFALIANNWSEIVEQ